MDGGPVARSGAPLRLIPALASADAYATALEQLDPWRRAIAEVCRREGLAGDDGDMRLGRWTGTYPTAIVGERFVVKLYGPWWSGPESYAAESAAYELLAADPGLPVPRLIAEGELVPGEWRYLVTSVVPGDPIGEWLDRIGPESMEATARWLGRVVRRLHAVPIPEGATFSPSWDAFAAFLAEQRRDPVERLRRWGSLPPHLADEADAWLPSVPELLDRSRPPALVHGDLHHGHLLGTLDGDRFTPTGVIDFTDGRVGDPYYELAPIIRAVFRADRRLLEAFLAEAGLPDAGALGFPRRALALMLLHDFDQYRGMPWLREIRDLDELAVRLFGSANLNRRGAPAG